MQNHGTILSDRLNSKGVNLEKNTHFTMSNCTLRSESVLKTTFRGYNKSLSYLRWATRFSKVEGHPGIKLDRTPRSIAKCCVLEMNIRVTHQVVH